MFFNKKKHRSQRQWKVLYRNKCTYALAEDKTVETAPIPLHLELGNTKYKHGVCYWPFTGSPFDSVVSSDKNSVVIISIVLYKVKASVKSDKHEQSKTIYDISLWFWSRCFRIIDWAC